ncbi:TetR/AcrR family transcriptional regulator [Streptomyces sp. NPDC046716]|uniref:TetR/AcrR family transcriptional regulator n=1 Tax=Streptomyces sp. NPDC046716 TaxID=3157093 RepID=UPI0033F6F6E3
MRKDAKASSRERLLEATAELTYREGVNVGVEALCNAAGVSKRSLYQFFDTKDELLAASLERRASAYAARLLPPPEAKLSPRERLFYPFTYLESAAAGPEYRGCPYLSVQVELKDSDHPARRVAHRVKGELTKYLRAAAADGGAVEPELLARQLMIILDGASARAGVKADDLSSVLLPAVTAVVDAAGVR